jgi:4-hydroxy-4-methyl-2-oxoglutarate aldolase
MFADPAAAPIAAASTTAATTTAARLVGLGVATLHEAVGRRGLLRGIRLLVGPAFAGRAATVAIPAGDNLGLHALLVDTPVGGVACVASSGDGRYGVLGELIAEAARAAGIAGLVVDDGVRDIDLLTAPPSIAARGVVATGTVKRRHLGIGGPIALGGQLVRPGDWVVADADGVCVIPSAGLDATVGAAEARVAKEDGIREALRSGGTTIAVLGLGPLLDTGEGRPG